MESYVSEELLRIERDLHDQRMRRYGRWLREWQSQRPARSRSLRTWATELLVQLTAAWTRAGLRQSRGVRARTVDRRP